MLPPVASFLCYLKGLAPVGLKYIAFGSYGWGGQSVQNIDKELESMKYERLLPPIKQYYKPTEADLNQIENDLIKALEN
jgi:flavorubredoxin